MQTNGESVQSETGNRNNQAARPGRIQEARPSRRRFPRGLLQERREVSGSQPGRTGIPQEPVTRFGSERTGADRDDPP